MTKTERLFEDTYKRLPGEAMTSYNGHDMVKFANIVAKPNTCSSCKHWGGQGTIGIQKTEGDERACIAYLFGDMDNPDFKPMPDWVATFGGLNGAKGELRTHKDFGCINHNSIFEDDGNNK